ncbi:secretin N-terminal domain-containing protein [Planctomycetes bacterium K23_9]
MSRLLATLWTKRWLPTPSVQIGLRALAALAITIIANATSVSAQEPLDIQPPQIPEEFLEAERAAIQPSIIRPANKEPENQFGAGKHLSPGTVRFSFDGTPWRDVISWIADEAQLALHVSDVPNGSFTYSDQSAFTYQQAVDRINLFLLPQGFTLVRSGKLLTVINLSDPRSMQQLESIAQLVTVEQLATRENHDVIKCIFPLGEIEAEDAVEELSALNLMTTPAVFSKTNQLMITDTAGRLKNVKAILDAFSPAGMENGTVVKTFSLQHVEAEDILLVARPHMGMATGEMIGIDVSLSADLEGKNIFVTGVEDKVKLLENLVASLDKPKKTMTNSGDNVLKAHVVEGGNVQTVYNVLLTLLADKEVRLSIDEEAGSVVALATPLVQKEIEATVEQLKASAADFEVIPLKTVDPYFVISLLEEMLDLPDALTDAKDIDPDTPKIDADPGNMRLFVRAKRPQIEQIKKIVAGLDAPIAATDDQSDMRILPLKGEEAERTLVTASKFWRGANSVIMYRSNDDARGTVTERTLVDEEPKQPTSNVQLAAIDLRNQRVLTSNASSKAAAIRCQVTSRGLLVQSDDISALDRFEEHLRTIAGPVESLPSAPVVYYLKYTRSDDALRMLAELLDGGESAREGEAGTLVNGFVSASSMGSFLGSFVTNRDGTTTMMSGSITVVADSRLNRLIAQGTSSDIELIEGYLKILDKDNSIIDIETHGTTRVIELVNTRASEVADVIRQAYGNRILATSGQPGQPAGGKAGSADQQREAAAAAKAAAAKTASKDKKGTDKNAASGRSGAKDLEPKMTLAVHDPSNSLIVTAPDALYAQVEKLARAIDERGEQAIEVITPVNGEVFESVLQQLLLGEDSQRSSRSASRTSSRSRSDR